MTLRTEIAIESASGWPTRIGAGALLVLTLIVQGCMFAEDAEQGLYEYKQGNYSEAASIWRRLAGRNDSTAQFYLGRMYQLGEGVPADLEKAAAWYRKAADAGNPYAQGNLAVLYAYGRGVPADFVLSYAWSSRAAAGYPKWADDLRAAAFTNRDIVAVKMTAPEILAAQQLSETLRR